jgi:hypothetical protein
LLVADHHVDLRWYDAADGRLLQELRIPAEAIEEVAFSHDAAWVAEILSGPPSRPRLRR